MNSFNEIFMGLIGQSVSQISEFATVLMPRLSFALLIALMGWVLAALVRKIATRLLKAFGFNVVLEKTGFIRIFEKSGITKTPAAIAGTGLYWLVLINTVIIASDALHIGVTVRIVEQFMIYIPRLVVVMLIAGAGFFFGRFCGKIVSTAARMAKIPFGWILGPVAGYIIVGLSLLLAVDYLEVTRPIAAQVSLFLIIIFPTAAFLLLLIGGKDIISSALASKTVSVNYRPGDSIRAGEITGRIVRVELVTTLIDAGDKDIRIPNAILATGCVEKQTDRN